MTDDNKWKRLEDLDIPVCVICMKDITRDYYTEVEGKIVCEMCAVLIRERLEEL